MRRQSWKLLALCIASLMGVSGCALPVYHLPQGFSSSYYRALQQHHDVQRRELESTWQFSDVVPSGWMGTDQYPSAPAQH